MSNMNAALERDRKELQSLFQEETEFKFWDLGRTYSSHELISVDGVPVEEGKRPIFYFYRDDVYISIDNRDPDYKGSLVGYDYGGQSNVAKYFYNNRLKKSTFEKLSIRKVLEDLYSNAKRR